RERVPHRELAGREMGNQVSTCISVGAGTSLAAFPAFSGEYECVSHGGVAGPTCVDPVAGAHDGEAGVLPRQSVRGVSVRSGLPRHSAAFGSAVVGPVVLLRSPVD